MRKAQVNQAFIYIAAILVIGLIIFVAAKGWNTIFKTNCEVQKAEFEKNIFAYIDQYSDYGTVKELSLLAPCDAIAVCFGDASAPLIQKSGNPNEFNHIDEVIVSNMNSKTANVFVKTRFTEAIGFSSKLAVDEFAIAKGEYVMCAQVKNGRVKLRFLGQGRTVMIEDAYS